MDEIKMVVLFMLLYDKKFSLVYNFLKSLLIMLIDWLYHKMLLIVKIRFIIFQYIANFLLNSRNSLRDIYNRRGNTITISFYFLTNYIHFLRLIFVCFVSFISFYFYSIIIQSNENRSSKTQFDS